MSDDLDDFLKESEKRVGYNVVQLASSVPYFKHIPTGSFTMDLALLGGIPEGVCTTLVGKKHSGKTLTAFKTVAAFQRKYNGVDNPKKYAIWFNVGEGIFPTAWASQNGVNVDELRIVTPPDAETCVDLLAAVMEKDSVGLCVLDAVPGLVSVNELEKSAEDAVRPGAVAGPLNRLLRKVGKIQGQAAMAGNYKTLILINQWRDGMSMNPAMKAPRTMPGGKLAGHYNFVELELYNEEVVGKVSDGNEYGVVSRNNHSFKIHKNKTGNSIREGEFALVRSPGDKFPVGTIDDFATVTTYAKKYGFVGGAGQGWWMIDPRTGEEIKFKGKGLIEEAITEDHELYEAMKRAIISKHRKMMGLSETGWW